MIINSLILQSCKTKQNFNMHVPRVTFNNPIASNIYVYILMKYTHGMRDRENHAY